MKRASAMLSVFALFASGLAIGALGMFLILERGDDPRGRHGPEGRGAGGPPRHARLIESLDLTEDQLRRIDEIRERSRRQSEEIRSELRPRIEQQMERTREEIRQLLTPDQQVEFDDLMKRQRRRMDRYFLGDGHRGPGRRRPGPPPDRP